MLGAEAYGMRCSLCCKLAGVFCNVLATLHVAACICKGILGFGGPWYYIPTVWLTLCMLCIGLAHCYTAGGCGTYCGSDGQGLTGYINHASRGFWREKHAWGQAEGIHVLDCPMETGTEVLNSDWCCASAVRDLQCTVLNQNSQ